MQALPYGIEVGTGKHFVAELIIDENRQVDAFVVKRIQKAANPFWQCTSEQYKTGSTLRQSVRLEDHLPFGVPCITISCKLPHFLAYHMPYLTIKHMGADGDSFTGCIGDDAKYFGFIVRSIGRELPGESFGSYRCEGQ